MYKVHFMSTFRLYTPFFHTSWFHKLDFSENTKIIYCEWMNLGCPELSDTYLHEIAQGSWKKIIWCDSGRKWPQTSDIYFVHLVYLEWWVVQRNEGSALLPMFSWLGIPDAEVRRKNSEIAGDHCHWASRSFPCSGPSPSTTVPG